MLNAPKKNRFLLPANKYGKSMKHSTCRRHQGHEGKCGLEAGSFQALEALRNLRFKKKLAAEEYQGTLFTQ
jgi:hypothetical protein